MSSVGAYRIRPTNDPTGAGAGRWEGEIFSGQRIQHERRGRCPLAPTFFSCLDARKGCEKKIKASLRPGNLAGYRILSLFVFCFLMSPVGAYCIRPPNDPTGAGAGRWKGPFLMSPVGAQKHTPSKRPDRGDLIYLWVGVFIPAGYMWGVFNTPLPYRQKKRRVRSWISPCVPGICHC